MSDYTPKMPSEGMILLLVVAAAIDSEISPIEFEFIKRIATIYFKDDEINQTIKNISQYWGAMGDEKSVEVVLKLVEGKDRREILMMRVLDLVCVDDLINESEEKLVVSLLTKLEVTKKFSDTIIKAISVRKSETNNPGYWTE